MTIRIEKVKLSPEELKKLEGKQAEADAYLDQLEAEHGTAILAHILDCATSIIKANDLMFHAGFEETAKEQVQSSLSLYVEPHRSILEKLVKMPRPQWF